LNKPLKTLVAVGAAGALTLALSATAFGSPGHSDPAASSNVDQSAHVRTRQHAHSNSGGNDVGNFTFQRNSNTIGLGGATNDETGSATLTTGSSSAANVSSSTVSQTNSSTVMNSGGTEEASVQSIFPSDPSGAASDVDQSAHVSTHQSASSNSGGNSVGNATIQTNHDTLGSPSNTADNTAEATTGASAAANSSTTSVTQSNTSSVTNG
jgi:hypothetical protein